jgi:hypothetical protein
MAMKVLDLDIEMNLFQYISMKWICTIISRYTFRKRTKHIIKHIRFDRINILNKIVSSSLFIVGGKDDLIINYDIKVYKDITNTDSKELHYLA